MGRAMLIICAGVLISLGFVVISTSNTGKMLTQKNVNYAEYTMAKNAAHTAIQIAMQKINQDNDWPNTHDINNPWVSTIQEREVALYMEYYQDANYWDPDSLWIYSNASYLNDVVQVKSLYLKQPFSSLVPEFKSAVTFAADPDKYTFTIGGNTSIDGNAPHCEDNKPGIVYYSDGSDDFLDDDNKESFGNSRVKGDPDQFVADPDLSYQPTDIMIERLYDTLGRPGGAQRLSTAGRGPYTGETFGTADEPGVFIVEDEFRVTGGKSTGHGILIIRTNADMGYIDEDGQLAEAAFGANFEFNGLVIFENAASFGSHGTPTINGSVLIGLTDAYPTNKKFKFEMRGTGSINYDCEGENYAKMAAAGAIQQNKYSRIVSTENVRFPSAANKDKSIIDKIKGLL